MSRWNQAFEKYIQLKSKSRCFFHRNQAAIVFVEENENTSRDPGFQKIIYTNMQLFNRPENEVLRILY